MALERSVEEKKMEHFRETMDRLTTADHVQVEYFAEHRKLDGYHENKMSGQFLNCDRLMKQDNMFGTLQLGYHPNRRRVFLLANMKTSRYDTVASRYQREMKEDMRMSLRKGESANRAFLSKRSENAAVLIEKRENMPWSQKTVRAYIRRANADSLQKTMPFLTKEEEQQEWERVREEQKQLQEDIREIQLQQTEEETEEKVREYEQQLRWSRQKAVQNLTAENLLQAIIIRKSAAEKKFFRRLNYAFEYQKKAIEAYYREKKKTSDKTSEHTEAEGLPEDEEE